MTDLVRRARQATTGRQTFTAPAAITAAMHPLGTEYCFAELDLTPADRTTAGARVRLELETSPDGVSWSPRAACEFAGNPTLPAATPIGVGLLASALTGLRVRVTIDTGVTKTMGVMVRTGTAVELGL